VARLINIQMRGRWWSLAKKGYFSKVGGCTVERKYHAIGEGME